MLVGVPGCGKSLSAKAISANWKLPLYRLDLAAVQGSYVWQFLFWLQECKKQVFVIATANDVSMLPSELLRRGRFDELFFVNLPTTDERRSIISMYMKISEGSKRSKTAVSKAADIVNSIIPSKNDLVLWAVASLVQRPF